MLYQLKNPQIHAYTFDDVAALLDGQDFIPNSGIMAHPTAEGNLALSSMTNADMEMKRTDMLLLNDKGMMTVVDEADFARDYEPVPEPDHTRFIVPPVIILLALMLSGCSAMNTVCDKVHRAAAPLVNPILTHVVDPVAIAAEEAAVWHMVVTSEWGNAYGRYMDARLHEQMFPLPQ